MKIRHVHEWALTQEFGLADNIEVANRLRDNRVDGEILRKLDTKHIEKYLGFNPSIASKIHYAIHPLLGLVDLTDDFDDQQDKIVVGETGKKCLVSCCCVHDESVAGDRKPVHFSSEESHLVGVASYGF
jgi:hypothetical protein